MISIGGVAGESSGGQMPAEIRPAQPLSDPDEKAVEQRLAGSGLLASAICTAAQDAASSRSTSLYR